MNEAQLTFIEHAIYGAREESSKYSSIIGRLDYELDVFESLLKSRLEDYPDDLAKITRLRNACSEMLVHLSNFEEEMGMFKEAFYDDSDND